MQRVASVKSVLQEKPEDDSRRSPECVKRVWTEEQDGAWAMGKASVQLLTKLLQLVQDDDVVQAELTARAILEVEPENQLVKDLITVLKQRETMEAEMESQSESEEEEEEESESEDENESDNENEDTDENAPQGSEEKNNEEK